MQAQAGCRRHEHVGEWWWWAQTSTGGYDPFPPLLYRVWHRVAPCMAELQWLLQLQADMSPHTITGVPMSVQSD
jgi:hypothetical protein